MKRIPMLLLTLAAMIGMTIPVFADAIAASPIEILEPVLPMILIIAVLVITALLVRYFTRKK